MTNANTFHSAVIALLSFGAIYFVALGIYTLKKWFSNRKKRKEDDSL